MIVAHLTMDAEGIRTVRRTWAGVAPSTSSAFRARGLQLDLLVLKCCLLLDGQAVTIVVFHVEIWTHLFGRRVERWVAVLPQRSVQVKDLLLEVLFKVFVSLHLDLWLLRGLSQRWKRRLGGRLVDGHGLDHQELGVGVFRHR